MTGMRFQGDIVRIEETDLIRTWIMNAFRRILQTGTRSSGSHVTSAEMIC